MTRTIALLAGAALVGLLAGTATVVWMSKSAEDRFASCGESSVAGGGAAIGGPFTLVDQTGTEVTEADVIDGLTLVYFGYTYCPDICPFDVARNAEATDILESRGIMVKPVMITVDPERDTPEVMAEFTEYMHPRMVGLTGTPEQVNVAKTAYKAYGAKAAGSEGDEYLVDHSTFTYLMAPGEGLLNFFRRDISAEEMADEVACYAENL